tara:strand:- start:713 stop:2056 length:1344 start_codon:yes stop_codon:yes gene_type:complete
MKAQSLLTADQQDCVDHLYENDYTLLDAAMGSGKSVVALTAIAELIRDGAFKHVLIIAPLKVCKTVWKQEAAGWEHTSHLSVARAVGTAAERLAAVREKADITVINFENIVWLFRELHKKEIAHLDALVVDELSKLKSGGGSQFKALRPRLKNFCWRVGLTGTPVSEDWLGLYAQMLVVDGGAALGTRKDQYQRKYFYPTDYMEFSWELHDHSPAEITKKIAHLVYTLPDYRAELPPITYETLLLPMPKSVAAAYEEMSETMVLDAEDVAAENAAVLSGKLLQIANGFYYTPDGDGMRISNYKIDACVAAVDDSDGPVVVFYWFKSDLAELKKRMPHAREMGKTPEQTLAEWNSGAIDVLLLHPRSAGHGLNAAAGGHEIIWLGPVWSRDLWEQSNARLWRRGQKHPVRVRSIIANHSIDLIVTDRVEGKGKFKELFKKHLHAVTGR